MVGRDAVVEGMWAVKHALTAAETKRQKPPTPKKRKRVNAVSATQQAKNERRAPLREAQLAKYPYCEAKEHDAPFPCFGVMTVHEPWTRARGGPIDDIRNYRTVCVRHNHFISQHPVVMRWASECHFLIHAQDGPAWLEAGGTVKDRGLQIPSDGRKT